MARAQTMPVVPSPGPPRGRSPDAGSVMSESDEILAKHRNSSSLCAI